MKKLLIFLCLILLFSCNSTKQVVEPSLMIANLFVDCSSLKEAEKIAGFSISIPKELNNKELIYRVLNTDEKMIEIIHFSSNDKLTIRKSQSTEDISGVYKTFDVEKKIIVDNKEVLIKGKNDIFEVALWFDNNFSYSISSNIGLLLVDLLSFIKQIK